jgi:ribonuclease D
MDSNHKEIKNEIESALDRIGATDFANLLCDVALEKAEHVQTNWQDRDLSRAWKRYAKAAEKLAGAGIGIP